MKTNKLKRMGYFILILYLICPVISFGQHKELLVKSLDNNQISAEDLNEHISQIIDSVNIPGLSVAIINDNELVYHNVFGVTNLQTLQPVNKKSIFEAASLSKPIFAYFVMKIVEEGNLDLDKPLHEYLPHPGIDPESEKDYKLITARMVLAHQTGFPNHSFGNPIKLAFRPGTDFMYSGEAYQYLAAVIGKVNGIGWGNDLNELFQNRTTVPLNMPHSSFVWDDYIARHKVNGHDKEGNPTPNYPRKGYWNGKTFNAFSSLHSEAGEYANFIITMLKKEGLQHSTFVSMLKEHTRFKDDNPLKQEIGQTGWGLGFAQKQLPDHTIHFHTGNNHDYQAYAMFIPEKKYGLVVFTNCGNMIPFLENLSDILGPQF